MICNSNIHQIPVMKELFQSCHVSASLAGDFVQYQLPLGQFSSIIRLETWWFSTAMYQMHQITIGCNVVDPIWPNKPSPSHHHFWWDFNHPRVFLCCLWQGSPHSSRRQPLGRWRQGATRAENKEVRHVTLRKRRHPEPRCCRGFALDLGADCPCHQVIAMVLRSSSHGSNI
jgi:hypothetical protein